MKAPTPDHKLPDPGADRRGLDATDLRLLASGVSHDMRAAVRSARLVASWLREPDPESKARQAEFLEHLDRRLTQLDSLSDGLIRYLRASDFDDPPARVELGALVHELQAELNIPDTTRIEVSPPPVEITLSREPLRAVLKELISNAVRHAGPHTRWLSPCA